MKECLKDLINNNWDYEFMLELEKFKIKKMIECFSKFEPNSEIIKDCKLTIKLIDIVLEKDEPFLQYLNSDSNEFPVYVNTRNAMRFDCTYVPILRQQKAWYLYNRMRYLKMLNWWL